MLQGHLNHAELRSSDVGARAVRALPQEHESPFDSWAADVFLALSRVLIRLCLCLPMRLPGIRCR